MDKTTEAMLLLYRDGSTLRELGDLFDINPSTISQRFSREGISAREIRAEQKREQLDETAQAMVRMYREGATLREVADRFGTTQSNVSRTFRRSGLSASKMRSERLRLQAASIEGAAWDVIKRLWGEGASVDEMAARSGVPAALVAAKLEKVGVRAASSAQPASSRKQAQQARQRAEKMYRHYASGASLQEVGDAFGVTRERVRQILKAGGFSTRDARSSARVSRKRALEAKIVERLHETKDIQAVAREFGATIRSVKKLADVFAPEAEEQLKPGCRVPNGYWTKDRILEAISRWAREYGQPPHATDWNIAAIRAKGYADREARYLSGLYPSVNTVRNKLGNWNDAIAAAGFDPTPRSSYGRPGDDKEIVAQGMRLYCDGLSLKRAAAAVGISPMTLERHLARAGQPLPADRRVEEIAEFLKGRNWTPVSTVADRIAHRGAPVYQAVREQTDLFELLDISERGLHVRLRRVPVSS